jgi:uncharacterized protein (DUF885 family)
MNRIVINFAILSIIFISSLGIASDNPTEEKPHALFDEFWEYSLERNPLFATSAGVQSYNDRLPVVAVEEYELHKQRLQQFLRRVEDLPREELSDRDRINYDFFIQILDDQIGELKFKTFYMPITNRSGFYISFPELSERVPLNTVRDYENYIARLNGFAEYTRQHIGIMREGIQRGFILPRIVLEGAEQAIEPHIVDDPTQSLLYRAFESFPESIPRAERDRLTEQGAEAIERSVVPGYRQFLDFMRDEYIPSARESIGSADLPEGRQFYQHRVRRFTTLDRTPEEVHQIGLSEVERIRREMEDVIEETGFDGSFDEFVEFLRTDPQFYAETPDQLMREVAYVCKKIDGELPRLFKTIPRMPYGIRPVPDYIAPRTTTAYYSRPSGDGTRAGYYYVNTYDLKSRPLYEIEALSLHEAVPGHHLQIALQQEIEGLPTFRRFYGFTAFSEGWALYAERLGLEVGFYSDPYSNFGRLTYEMWRALRLVVDTGMHYLGWTREEAIDFMTKNSALTIHNITTEVDRYIAWPGQALAYKTGELKIRELRARAEETLGERFDVREFHDAVLLNGSIPLRMLENNIMEYIETVMNGIVSE